MNRFIRNELAIGKEGLDLLSSKTVCIVGVGGVGSYAAETLARSNIGKLILVDKDVISDSNINRQLHSLTSTIDQSKTVTMKNRIKDINPNCEVITLDMFYNQDTYKQLFDLKFDYLIDSCDTVSSKIHLIKTCLDRRITFICAMGAANKSHPELFKISDIKNTKVDPLAKVIRTKLKSMGINKKVPVVYSEESPYVIDYSNYDNDSSIRKESMPPSSNAFCPSVCGILCASYIYNQILKDIKISTKEG